MRDKRHEILDFWFKDTKPQQWFQTNEEFDTLIKERFFDVYDKAAMGILDDWRTDSDGALALCLLLDQFPRNMFRETPKAFTTDNKALVVAKYAISKGLDQVLSPEKKPFIYLPFEHSENLNDQRRAVELFEKIKDVRPLQYEYAVKHLKVIEEYGRFPHRNRILGRENTPEEESYLAQPGAGF